MLARRPHTTCGGRPLNDDIVDILYTLLVGGIDGPRVSDGVYQATQPATHSFPYLLAPNPEPPDIQTVVPRWRPHPRRRRHHRADPGGDWPTTTKASVDMITRCGSLTRGYPALLTGAKSGATITGAGRRTTGRGRCQSMTPAGDGDRPSSPVSSPTLR